MNAVGSAEGSPHTLFVVQPARMPAARFAAGDVVPERVDRSRELERRQAQGRAGRGLVELQPKQSSSQAGKIDIAALAGRRRRRVQGFPAPAADRGPNTEAARRRLLEPIADQTADPARL